MTNFKSLYELLDHFKEQATCVKHLENQIWPDGVPVCPHCGSCDRNYVTNRGYKCRECKKKFTCTVGTIFESTKLPLRLWFGAIYLCAGHKKGVSSCQLARDLNCTQKSAWFMLHRIREMLLDKNPNMVGDEGVEIDETYYGGKEKNKHKSKRTEGTQGRSLTTKQPILLIAERGGKVVIRTIKDTSASTIKPIMVDVVKPGATIYTDEWLAYRGVDKLPLNSEVKYKHEFVKHNLEQYVVGSAHTNNCEGFFSHLKRGIYGIHHSVSKTHLHRYCNAQAFRWNTRTQTDNDRFDIVLQQSVGRLTYKKLIKK